MGQHFFRTPLIERVNGSERRQKTVEKTPICGKKRRSEPLFQNKTNDRPERAAGATMRRPTECCEPGTQIAPRRAWVKAPSPSDHSREAGGERESGQPLRRSSPSADRVNSQRLARNRSALTLSPSPETDRFVAQSLVRVPLSEWTKSRNS